MLIITLKILYNLCNKTSSVGSVSFILTTLAYSPEMIHGVFTTYSPLLKESLHLSIPFSYYPLFVCAMDEKKENKDFCLVS